MNVSVFIVTLFESHDNFLKRIRSTVLIRFAKSCWTRPGLFCFFFTRWQSSNWRNWNLLSTPFRLSRNEISSLFDAINRISRWKSAILCLTDNLFRFFFHQKFVTNIVCLRGFVYFFLFGALIKIEMHENYFRFYNVSANFNAFLLAYVNNWADVKSITVK